jgi:hypothetical protein
MRSSAIAAVLVPGQRQHGVHDEARTLASELGLVAPRRRPHVDRDQRWAEASSPREARGDSVVERVHIETLYHLHTRIFILRFCAFAPWC